MKKLFIAVAAIAAAVACNTAEIVDLPSNPAIAFENAFIQNASRVGTTTETLEAFDVWAYINEKAGTVLTDEDVTKANGQWGYANLQYWAPGHMYYFTALAPMNSANWDLDFASDVVSFTNVDGTEDLLYATAQVSTADLQLGGEMEPVALTFDHLLSKVNFTFKNGFATDNVKIQVKNVTMTAVKAAQYTLGAAAWTNATDADLTLSFGDVETLASGANASVADERLTIPTAADYVYGIKFYVDVYFGAVKAIADHEFNSTLTGAAFEIGKAYNLSATINAENLEMPVIEFTLAEVKDWVNQEINGGVIGEQIKVVSTLEELQAALDAATGDTAIAVGADLTGNVLVPELKGATISINGNGHKFDGTFALVGGSTYGEGTTIIENFAFETAALNGYDAFIYCNDQNGHNRYPDNVTIKDCTFKGDANAVAAKFRSLKGNLVVENVTVEGHSLLQLSSCGEANVVVDGATVNAGRGISLGTTGNAVIKNSTFVAASYGIRADGCKANTTIENTTIEAVQPIVVRKVTAAGYVLNVDAASTLTTAEPYQIVFTKGADDAEYVMPSAAFTCNAPATISIFPTVVSSAEGLEAAMAANKAKTIYLSADIDLSGAAWAPVGTESAPFLGSIDGMGHKLVGLNAAGDYAALIAFAGANTSVKNVVLEDVNIDSSKYGAAVVAVGNDNVVVENVTVSGVVKAASYAAGIVCLNSEKEDPSVTIKNCVNNATVTSNRAGGVAAWMTGNSVIEGCVNNGDVTGAISACGITNRIKGSVKNCVNNGTIVGNGTEASAGIAGTQTAASSYEYCYNYGNVTTTKDNANSSAAGILGQANQAATINYCANYGAITAEKSYAAGIAYSLYGTITASYCYNEGAVIGEEAAGGIAPKAQYGANDTAKYCLNAGALTATAAKGKVYQGSNKNTSCYYYNAGALLNVADNAAVAEADALAVLNGGADANFFSVDNGVITVK